MRILQLHTRYRYEGGEDAVVRAEAALLAQAGHEVIPYVAENPGSAGPAAAAMLASPWNPAAARRLRAAARRARPDGAHVHTTWFALTPSVVAALDGIGVPVVVTLHNYRLLCANASLFRDGRPCQDCVGTHPWHGVQHRCYRDSAVSSTAVAATIAVNRALGTWERHVRLFLALNDFARDRFVAGGLPADRVWVKPNSVGDPGPRAVPPSRSRTVLVAGRLTPEKGVGVLLEAWRRLAPADLELVVAGDGPMRAELERRTPPGVRFLGQLDPAAVQGWMLRSRALVFPTWLYEGQPMSVLEAFAAGLPVLASRLGGNAELVGALGDGWLAPARDPDALAQRLAGLADDLAVDAAGTAARRLYEARFAERHNLRALEAAYRYCTIRSRSLR
ncbi:MAG TPA: glycosyltransferase family 4 protein [Actinomycetes bacterium]|nr:glycosyltransferase family 4 protein [Actinomycetes bacterium]